MYRLKVKFGRGWKLGWNKYNTLEEAEDRKIEMESVGHRVKIVKVNF